MSELDIHFEDRMSDEDALMWNIEKDPALRSTITTVMTFDSVIPHAALQRRIERLSRVIPRLRQRVRSNPLSIAPPRWEVDPHFDLNFHLWWTRCPGKRGLADVLELAEPIAMSGFDRARPLWRTIVVEGMKGGGSAIIMKVHHSITDGVGGVALMLELFDGTPDAPERDMPDPPKVHVMSQPERIVDAYNYERRRQLEFLRRSVTGGVSGLAGALSNPAGTVSGATQLAASVGRVLRPVAHPMSPLMTGRSLSCEFDTLTLPLDATKAAAKAAGGKLNDAFVAGIAMGLADYHRHHGIECDELRMSIPINVRKDGEAVAGNAFVPARIELNVGLDDPVEMMCHVREMVTNARHEPANDLVEPVSNILNRLPTTATTALFGSMVKGVDFTTSNVPGAPIPLYLAGVELTGQYPFGPLAGTATNITLLSYQNNLNIGINSDPAAVEDAPLLTSCCRAAYDRILASAG